MNRIIMHYDMDAFYCSVELNRNPHLKDKPFAVGGNIITTASYSARKFGVHSAMKVSDARILCPKLIVIPVDKNTYYKISKEIQNLVLKITNKVEFIALDEGYIDLTDVITNDKKEFFAEKFKERIFEITNLTCSVGIGFNKLSAKIASDINKPFGKFIFNNENDFMDYIREKKISIIPGVGRKFTELLKKDNITLVKDAYKFDLNYLVKKYGKSRGENLYCSIRGINYDEVEYKRPIHSIGNEETFFIPIENNDEVLREINSLFDYTFERLIKKDVFSQSVTLKIRYVSFETITRSKKLKFPTQDKTFLYLTIQDLLNSIEINEKIRLIGIYFGDIKKNTIMQLQLNENF